MTYRSLLVHLDREPACEARTRLAIRLARDMDCHLVGLAATGLVDLPVVAEAGASFAQFATLAWEALLEEAQRAAADFSSACKAASLRSYEAVVDESEKVASIVRHAHCSDLTVLSQADPKAPGHRSALDLVERVVLYSARPTLVVPYAGKIENTGSSALVAWDDSRESARALNDALPLLRRAATVQVVSWNEGRYDDATLPQRLSALEKWLMWQGVSAEVRTETSEIGVADALLSRAADMDADLIVMGAYGHTRLAERVLGGATRGLLTSMTVPVLMSH